MDCSDGELKIDDIILMPCKYDYGCGNEHPIDKMSFYKNDLNLELISHVNDIEYGIAKPQ